MLGSIAKFATIALVAAGLAGSATAGSISISTGVNSGWKFTGFRAGDNAANNGAFAFSGSALTLQNQTNAQVGQNAFAIAAHPAWNNTVPGGPTFSPEQGLSWISALANGNQKGLYGFYSYELTLDSSVLTAGKKYAVSGLVSSDNLISSFSINGGPNLLSDYLKDTEFSYRDVSNLPGGVGGVPLTIRIEVFNMSSLDSMGDFGMTPTAGTNPNTTDNPTGFILQGSLVQVVPLPTAGWAGLALMATCGVMQYRRKLAMRA